MPSVWFSCFHVKPFEEPGQQKGARRVATQTTGPHAGNASGMNR